MTKMLSVRVDDHLLRSVDEVAEREGRARADAVREALEAWIAARTTAARVRQHRDGYARKPVQKDEFSPVLGAQVWPK